MARYNVLVTVTRTFRISGMEALSEDDVCEQLDSFAANNELDENMDVTADEVTETASDMTIDDIEPTGSDVDFDNFDDRETDEGW